MPVCLVSQTETCVRFGYAALPKSHALARWFIFGYGAAVKRVSASTKVQTTA